MYISYLDESGDSQAINSPTDNIQPILIISCIFIKASDIPNLTMEFIDLKRKFFPKKFSNLRHDLDALPIEIKGCDLRTDIRKNPLKHTKVKHHLRFLDELITILEKYQVRLVSRIWVKSFSRALIDKSVYTITTQHFCIRFNKFLKNQNSAGVLIADFRDTKRNSYVSHSIFTKKFKKTGDEYPNLKELPTFGISNNHAGLQICDLLTSAILYPMASQTYCEGIINNTFTHTNFKIIKQRYAKRIRSLQFHSKCSGTNYWGISANDPHLKKDGNAIFKI